MRSVARHLAVTIIVDRRIVVGVTSYFIKRLRLGGLGCLRIHIGRLVRRVVVNHLNVITLVRQWNRQLTVSPLR